MVLITDVETGGLDPEVHPCIEVAAVLYDASHACVVESYASLILASSNEAEAINRIPVSALANAPTPAVVWGTVSELAGRADAFVAHNAPFDKSFYPTDVASLRPWIDTKADLMWPRATLGYKLVVLALAHDLGVSHAHRSMVDCDLIARLFTRVHEMGVELEVFLRRGLRPKATFLSLAPFEDRAIVKAAGFSWFPEKKQWLRTMAIEDARSLPFQVKEVPDVAR